MIAANARPHPVDPAVDLEQERLEFAEIQRRLAPMFQRIFPDRLAPRTVVVIPSLSFDVEELSKITGVYYYEERMLCMLMLLQLPRTNVIYITSQPIHRSIIDYYLHLLPGIPSNHAQRRLTMLSCHDASALPLTQKILQRPRLLDRIQSAIPDPQSAHITCFNASRLERALAVRLGIPLYACDPALRYLGSKSHGREIFRQAGVDTPTGYEHLRDVKDLTQALTALKQDNQHLRKAVIKLNDSFSGEGNAIFSFDDHPSNGSLESWIAAELPRRIKFEANGETWPHYARKLTEMGGIVERWIDADGKRSPSVQCRINPLGQTNPVSTHDQILGGPSNQIFLGCSFPAAKEYRLDIQNAGARIADVLKQEGALGRFGVDFISVQEGERWKHYAVEINLRKGGTTLPYLMLQFLTDGEYDPETGHFHISTGQPRYYFASDNLQKPTYKGLTPDDLIDTMVYHDLHFHGAAQEGVVLHLMGALSEFGKLGVVCIGKSRERAQQLYDQTMVALDRETGVQSPNGDGPARNRSRDLSD